MNNARKSCGLRSRCADPLAQVPSSPRPGSQPRADWHHSPGKASARRCGPGPAQDGRVVQAPPGAVARGGGPGPGAARRAPQRSMRHAARRRLPRLGHFGRGPGAVEPSSPASAEPSVSQSRPTDRRVEPECLPRRDRRAVGSGRVSPRRSRRTVGSRAECLPVATDGPSGPSRVSPRPRPTDRPGRAGCLPVAADGPSGRAGCLSVATDGPSGRCRCLSASTDGPSGRCRCLSVATDGPSGPSRVSPGRDRRTVGPPPPPPPAPTAELGVPRTRPTDRRTDFRVDRPGRGPVSGVEIRCSLAGGVN